MPVAIAVQRYLLVCRAVFCHSVGGKKIWKYIHSAVVLLGTLCGTAFVFERDSSLTFLRCMGQEEKFWSVPILRIIADSAQTEYCTTFHCPRVRVSVCHRPDISHIYKVNRCLARYSPRATTTNRPTNRALNKPACPGPN